MPLMVDIRKLTILNSLVESSAHQVAEDIEALSGVKAKIRVTGLTFIDPTDMPVEIGSEPKYGVDINLMSPPYGRFLMTFSYETASQIAELMTGEPVEGEFNQIHESALQEMCNILTSGFVDGWANELETSIEMDTPDIRYESGDEIAEKALSHVHNDSLSMVIDTVLDVEDDSGEFELKCYMIPDAGSFVHMIDRFDFENV